VVDIDVQNETKRLLLTMFPDDPVAMLDYAFKHRVLDVNKCRIAIIKRYFSDLRKGGMKYLDALDKSGETFSKSPKTIENIVTNDFYKLISI